MKLKVAILASSFIVSLFSLGDTGLQWLVGNYLGTVSTSFPTSQKLIYTESKEKAISISESNFPIRFLLDPKLDSNFGATELKAFMSTNYVAGQTLPYVSLSTDIGISNIVTGENIPASAIYGQDSPMYNFIRTTAYSAQKNSKGLYTVLCGNALVGASRNRNYAVCLIDTRSYIQNVINTPGLLTQDLISENVEIIKNYLSGISGTMEVYLENINTVLEQNSGITQNGFVQITNLLYGISLDSYTSSSYLNSIKEVTSTFAEDQRINQLASGQIVSTLNPSTTGGSSGVIYEALDQLIRINYLKQGRNISDSELATMSTIDKWENSGMAAKYGSYTDNYNNGNMGKIVAVEAITENQKFQNKVSDLSAIADQNGNVVDPLTGELTKLNDAIAKWDKQKTDGAIASYSYNNPAATNGFFGVVKRTLTEEGDWRLLDKAVKDKQQSFMDNVIQSGVKVNTHNGPIAVHVQNDEGIVVNFPEEAIQTTVFKTSNSTLNEWYHKWLDKQVLWSNFTGVENHNDRGFLDIMLERNDLYYSYVTNKMYGTVSNQLARLIELNEYTNRQNFVDVPRSTYVRYLMRGIGTTDNNDDDLFSIKDEPTFAFDGSTNFEQAVAFQLHDLFEVSQNGSKADMMSADFIRGIYQLLGTGSNIAVQVAYITNTVYKANGLSTDKNDYSSYEHDKEKLDADFTEFNGILEEMQEKTVEKINFVSYRVFADHTFPSSLTLLEFNNQKFEIDLNKWDKIFIMMHNCAQLAWLAVGLLMLPRVAYMLICFGLKMLGKFYGILTSK